MAALRNRKMGNILKDNKSFCTAAWLHSYISPQGERQLCCISNADFGVNVPIDNIWNSDKMKTIRKKMLNGEILKECDRCNDMSINPTPYRDYWNLQYEWHIENLIKNTKEDGTYDILPKVLDYRTNVCNFACKMCTEEFSSQIQGEKIRNGINLQFNILDSKQREESLKLIDNEFSNDEILKNIIEIYWAGGEPLYWKTHWETLDRLIQKGYSKKVKIRYSSNLSTIQYKGNILTDYFKHFGDIEFYCSLDATGTIGEWIRTNLDYNNWKKNFEKLVEFRNQNKQMVLRLAVAFSIPTLFDLENLYQLCMEYNVEPEFQTCYSENSSNLLSPKSFPKHMVENMIDTFLKNHNTEDNNILNKFKNYFSFLLAESFYENNNDYDTEFKKGIEMIHYLEKNRPHSTLTFENILSYNKEVLNFYNEKK